MVVEMVLSIIIGMRPTKVVSEVRITARKRATPSIPSTSSTRAATESLYLMLCYAMDDLKYRRMQWRCNALNEKSRAAARRLGFRFEGIFHNHMIFKGRNRDTAWYSILDDEWGEVRDIMTRWLDGANFDPEGTAKTSLSAAMATRGESTRAT